MPEKTDNGAAHNYYHQANDHLRGWHVYGSYEDNAHSDNAFSLKFDDLQFDQFLFSTSSGNHWGIMTKEQVWKRSYGNIPKGGYMTDPKFQAYYGWYYWLKSSMKNSPYRSFGWFGNDRGCRNGRISISHHFLNSGPDGNGCNKSAEENYFGNTCIPNGNDQLPVPSQIQYYKEFPIDKFSDSGTINRQAEAGYTIYMARNDPHVNRNCHPNSDPLKCVHKQLSIRFSP